MPTEANNNIIDCIHLKIQCTRILTSRRRWSLENDTEHAWQIVMKHISGTQAWDETQSFLTPLLDVCNSGISMQVKLFYFSFNYMAH